MAAIANSTAPAARPTIGYSTARFFKEMEATDFTGVFPF
jgi:hypothetical protein